jgi:alkylated DNA repair dioxygenase AlkB
MTIDMFRQHNYLQHRSAGNCANEKYIEPEKFALPQADILFWPQLFDEQDARELHDRLFNESLWRQEQIAMYGKQIDVPRLSAWHADSGRHYAYSGIKHQPSMWSELLLSLKLKVEELSGARFNSVLCNLYRDGNDGVAWHSDDEHELGKNPVIASLSFGETRTFQFRKRDDHSQKFSLELSSGSCLIMSGETQHAWHHQIPKSSASLQARINLTFRYIY